MELTSVTAVVGSCVPERRAVAHGIAQRSGSEFIHAERLAAAADPVREATALIPWTAASRVVVEYPVQAPMPAIIGSLVDPEEPTRLVEVVCVIDATHFFSELERTDRVEHLEFHQGTAFTTASARALLTAQQIEYCSTALLTNAQHVPSEERDLIRALIGELAPWAKIVLEQDADESFRQGADDAAETYGSHQVRPGWIAHLNGLHTARPKHPRVASMRYTNPRPFNPVRLQHTLDEHLEPGAGGKVIRSCGFCRLASRPGITAAWSHTGAVMVIDPLARDDTTPGEPLSFGQDIILTGIDLRPVELTRILDEAVLDDAELLSDPASWRHMPDPFPAWVTAGDRFE